MTTSIDTALYRAPSLDTPARVVGSTPPRLVLPGIDSTDWGLQNERELGYFGEPIDGPDFLIELERSGLRGRGGAGFPAHLKWATVAAAPGPKVVVANGHEGEPASLKDTWLLTRRPHLVLDGLLLAAATVGADEAIVYVSRPEAVAAVERAIDEVRTAGLIPENLRVSVHRAEHTYVAGEESAVCRSIGGFPAKPTSKPPRPFQQGVHGLPTLISNVESLAHAAWIRVHGAEEFASVGSASSKGTALFTLTGACASPGVFEMSLGLPLLDLASAGGMVTPMTGVLIGGWFGGILTGDHGATLCCYDAVRAIGSGLGCAAVTVLGPDDDIIEMAGELSAWFQHESAMQCGTCVSGTNAIARAFRQVLRGDDDPSHRQNLMRWGATTPGRGACGFIDGAFTLARTAGAELARRKDNSNEGVLP
ncbi:NADH-ubiquinone oxidoreductase-F iron-sulfur binding region domain-containing protein [Rhodococcus artemisiae]|uniref:NADH-ubiquinone oxidoreductase-F iron-sulfur binding region domain-containing protein n=1 Tax=Rhodococcus artemisiae TaxID=714159 RepID=A0ABU7LFK9_9NOCA|nr:NADH-ubiquinone oxidoreductase-F iron-sulfur binding region domain-containing protein [Rhodococcus artemisiae]MEE2060354.1 NADH-ubiquinone oxidoreductase-F iron-sulfur binding region domain-containing protein [Rhodococcus artemisiae]